MTLETLLREAAPEATFTPDDVRTLVDRTRHRRKVGIGLAAVVLLAAGVVGALALTGDDGERQVIAGPAVDQPVPVPFTDEALVGSRWIDETEGVEFVSTLEFVEDGTALARGCGHGDGTWSVRDGRLSLAVSRNARNLCLPHDGAYGGEATLFSDGLLRFRGDREGGPQVVELRRVDSYGSAPTSADQIVGSWITPLEGIDLAFDDSLQIGPCTVADWAVTDTAIEVAAVRDVDGLCAPGVPARDVATATDWLTRLDEVRLDGDRLLLSGDTTTGWIVREAAAVDASELAGFWLAVGTDGRLLTDFHIDVFLGDGSFPSALGLPDEPSLRTFYGCDFVTSRWTLSGSTLALATVDTGFPYCLPPDQADLLPSQDGPAGQADVLVLDGDELVAGDVRYRNLRSLDAPVGGVLEGSWTGEEGAVTFQAEGTLQTQSCVNGTWDLTNRRLEIRDCPELDGTLEAAIGPDGALYLARPGTVRELHRVVDEVPLRQPAETLLLDAYEAMGVELCCQEPPEGRDWGLIGFVWNGRPISVVAQPAAGAPAPTAREIVATCSGYRVSVLDAADAAQALFDQLGCTD